MPFSHEQFTIKSDSIYLNHIDPAKRTKFRVGDIVLVCSKNGEAIALESLDILNRKCPFCGENFGELPVTVSVKSPDYINEKFTSKSDARRDSERYRPFPWSIVAIFTIISLVIGVAIGAIFTYQSTKLNEQATQIAKMQTQYTEAPLIPTNPVSTITQPVNTDISPDCSKAETFCIGLVTDVGKINDFSFNQSAWEGVKQAETDLNAKVNYIETADSQDYRRNIATFADAKFDVIVTIGFAMNEATIQAANDYPNIKFIGVDQIQDANNLRSNFAGLIFPEDQAGFLAGALAAQMSKSGKVGAVCGTDVVPPVWRYCEGYRNGALYINPNSRITIVYHNDVGFDKTFSDPEWGIATANAMVDNGTDVIFGAGGETSNGALKAVAQRGIYAIGSDVDQYYTLSDVQKGLLSSALKLIAPSVFDLLKMAKENTFPGGSNFTGYVGYASFHDLDAEVPVNVKAKMQDITQALLAGSLSTGVSAAKP